MSFLQNASNRRKQLLQVRERLLDRPGIARQGGPPPPTIPAQDRTSRQEDELAKLHPPEGIPKQDGPEEVTTTADSTPEGGLSLDEETREELLESIRPVVAQMRVEKQAQLHRDLGRVRRFFGGGI